MSHRILVVGAGRAGRGLARALRVAGCEVAGVHGRRPDPGFEPPVTDGALPPAAATASVILVAVRDGQLDDAIAELAAARLAPGAVVLHLSGSAEPAGLAELRRAGHPSGTFHPLVPLVDAGAAPAALRGAWIGVDGDAGAVEVARGLAAQLGAHVLEIPPGAKGRYHAAAVFASNFPTVLAAIAQQLLHQVGIEGEASRDAVLALMVAAVRNLREREPADALTGPIARGDLVTVERHLAALADDRDTLGVYAALSRAALRMVAAATDEPGRLDGLRALQAALDAAAGAPPAVSPLGGRTESPAVGQAER